MEDATHEEWRPVPDHPLYEVSSLGRVRSYKSTNGKRLDVPKPHSSHADPAGYIRTSMDGKHIYVHQAVAAAWHGPCPIGKEVGHINHSRGDNRPENLCYLTRQENLAERKWEEADECPLGHPLSGENLYIRPTNGRRECRRCNADRTARFKSNTDRPDCSEPDCDRIATSRLRTDRPICEMHYQRERKAEKRRQRELLADQDKR